MKFVDWHGARITKGFKISSLNSKCFGMPMRIRALPPGRGIYAASMTKQSRRLRYFDTALTGVR